jgi:hypothetical protein
VQLRSAAGSAPRTALDDVSFLARAQHLDWVGPIAVNPEADIPAAAYSARSINRSVSSRSGHVDGRHQTIDWGTTRPRPSRRLSPGSRDTISTYPGVAGGMIESTRSLLGA